MTKQVKVKGEELYHIYPVKDVHIAGVPAREMDVTEDEWLDLNRYQPPAFVCDPLPPEQPKQEEKARA
jgi:hypothetical protein